MAEFKHVLIPQFSIRWLLGATAVLSPVFLVIAQAVRGKAWAFGIAMALLAIVVMFLFHAIAFSVLKLLGDLGRSVRKSSEDSQTKGMLLAWLLLGTMTDAAWAEIGQEVQATLSVSPTTGATIANPLTVSMDTTWVNGNGYQPLHIKVSMPNPSTDEHLLTFRVHISRNYFSWRDADTVTQDLRLPVGSKAGQLTLSVPHFHSTYGYDLEVWDNGELLQGLNLQATNGSASRSEHADTFTSPRVLILHDRSGKHDPWRMMTGHPADYLEFGPIPGVNRSFSDLPDRWIDYTCFDLVQAHWPQLVALAQQHPQKWEAIRQWTLAGGNLWVHDFGARWNGLADLQSLLKLPAKAGEADESMAGWIEVDRTGPIVTPGVPVGRSRPLKKKLSDPQNVSFKYQPFGMGVVVVRQSADLYAESMVQDILEVTGRDRLNWVTRHGMGLQSPNMDFWNFVIPGVGAAPVLAFQALITLFVVAIGPVNYYVLRRSQKLNLMIITVPLSALAATAALFLYAVLADGFTTRVRAKSYTQLDQHTGEAVCHARQSYYAGLGSAQGLTFPEDVAAYPLEFDPADEEQVEGRALEMAWVGGELRGAFPLAPRTPKQVYAIRCRPSQARLTVEEPGGSPPRVKNDLGAPIRHLWLIDSHGDAFTSNDLSRETATTLQPIELAKAIDAFSKHYQAQRDASLIQRRAGQRDGMFGFRRNYYYHGPAAGPIAQWDTSLLESALQGIAQDIDSEAWFPRTYVAIVERSPEVVLGQPSLDEEASFHVIVGKW